MDPLCQLGIARGALFFAHGHQLEGTALHAGGGFQDPRGLLVHVFTQRVGGASGFDCQASVRGDYVAGRARLQVSDVE